MTLDSLQLQATSTEVSAALPSAPSETGSFATLGLTPALLDAVAAAGYTIPTPVQSQAIPPAIAGRDLLVSSQTGSGKTAAFLLPALHRLAKNPSAAPSDAETTKRGPSSHGARPSPLARQRAFAQNRTGQPRVLVLAPTRELALQVQKVAFEFSRAVRGVRTAALVGGTPYAQQLRALSDGADIVVATPGRLIDHLERRSLTLDRIELVVLDEADRMLDMGFIEDIESIVKRTPATRQTVLFSATLDGVVGNLARELTKNPLRVQVGAAREQVGEITQQQLHADGFAHKGRLLDALLRDAALEQAIVFTSTKQTADDLRAELHDAGFPVAALHGDMQQRERTSTLHRLREGRIRVLVATDVAARGIDVAGITHVINFDLPRQAEDYTHRIGRTGRAGRTGTAISFVAPSEHRQMKTIERVTGARVQVITLPGLEPTVKPRSEFDARRGGKPGRFAQPGRPRSSSSRPGQSRSPWPTKSR